MALTIEYIMKEWEEDAEINNLMLEEESKKIPKLHAKYINMYTHEKLRYKHLDMKHKILLKEKWLYYNGKYDKAELDRKGWSYDPYDGHNKSIKGDMDIYYNADPDMQASQLKMDYQKEMIDLLKEILESIKWRHQSIKNAIDFMRFTSGG